ncbi:hypothetical protein ACEE90_01590 [Corynebacterium phoceense]|uniref:hypothetical protein n=1 Tax=Corynebacterium phoceense TaxID=1686286 RepID=UPI00211B9AF6|nr:hypothetical protein [Corynebacterium phoceense]MCQ9333219.1 hypothetical protein [Corynebacterium phoceense]
MQFDTVFKSVVAFATALTIVVGGSAAVPHAFDKGAVRDTAAAASAPSSMDRAAR